MSFRSKGKIVNAWMMLDFIERLDALAKKWGISRAEVLRDAAERGLNELEKEARGGD